MGLGTRRGRGWISGLKIPLKPLFWHKPPSHTDVIISSSYLTSTTTQTYDKHICCQHIIIISSQWVFIDKTTQQLQKLFKVSLWFWVTTHFKKSCCHVASWHNAMFLERALIDVSVLISKAFPKFLIVYSCEFGFVLEHNFPFWCFHWMLPWKRQSCQSWSIPGHLSSSCGFSFLLIGNHFLFPFRSCRTFPPTKHSTGGTIVLLQLLYQISNLEKDNNFAPKMCRTFWFDKTHLLLLGQHICIGSREAKGLHQFRCTY